MSTGLKGMLGKDYQHNLVMAEIDSILQATLDVDFTAFCDTWEYREISENVWRLLNKDLEEE